MNNVRCKINWNAVTALAAIGAVIVYAVQAFYMYHTLNAMKSDLVLTIYSQVREAQSRLLRNKESFKYFKNLLDPKNTSNSEDLLHPEIYDYFNLLDALSHLYLLGIFKDESFPYLYKGAILHADCAVHKTPEKERDFYKSIIQVAKIFSKERRRENNEAVF